MTTGVAHGDPQLLAIARRILERAGFSLRESTVPGLDVEWLLAEDELFVIGVAAGSSFRDLQLIEAHAAPVLTELLKHERIGAKRWDAHLVLLAPQGAEERGRSEVVDLQQNTRALRRIVNLGVTADDLSVRRALSPFLPLPEPGSHVVTSTYAELVEQLVVNGVDRAQAEAAVATYRQHGTLEAL